MQRSTNLNGWVRTISPALFQEITYRLAHTKFQKESNLPWSRATWCHEAVNYPFRISGSKLTTNVMLPFSELFVIILWKEIQLTPGGYTRGIWSFAGQWLSIEVRRNMRHRLLMAAKTVIHCHLHTAHAPQKCLTLQVQPNCMQLILLRITPSIGLGKHLLRNRYHRCCARDSSALRYAMAARENGPNTTKR